MKKKVVYIISNINKALAFEWVANYLNQDKYDLVFILLNPSDSALEQYLKTIGIRVHRVTFLGKKSAISSLFQTYKIIKKEKADVVHAHLIDACLIGLFAAYLAGVKKRIHTRHNSTYHHLFFPRAVWYDKLVNYLSSDIISISNVVTMVLTEMEGVDSKKIQLIHHGFVFESPELISQERVNGLKLKYRLTAQDSPIIGMISRFISWKGIQYTIQAFHELLKKHKGAVLLLANAQGPYKKEIEKMLSSLPGDSYRVIPFEEDVFALYRLFDVFVHVPIDPTVEAFGQTYVESLAMRVPSVFTLSGIANEFIKDKENSLVVKHEDYKDIVRAIELLLSDDVLSKRLALTGQKEVLELFDVTKMIDKLEQLYAR